MLSLEGQNNSCCIKTFLRECFSFSEHSSAIQPHRIWFILFAGSIPATIGNLKVLEELFLGDNNLTGEYLGPLCSVATRALTICVPRFCFSFASFSVLFLPSIPKDVGATTTTGVFSCFQMGFYFVTTGWIFEIGLSENSTNQINQL